MSQNNHPWLLAVVGLFVLVCVGTPVARAASVSIQNISPSTSLSPGETMSFYAAANGFGEPTYSVTSGSGSIDAYGYYTWTPTPDDAGGNTITITVNDLSGATASSSLSVYVIPNVITIQNLLPGTTAFTREPVTFTVHTPGFTSPSFYVRDSYAGTTVSNNNVNSGGSFSWTPAVNEQGMHTLTVTATDNYGHNAIVQQSILVLPPSTQVINLTPGTSIAVGTPLTFSASTTGLTNPIYTVSDSLGWFSTVNASSTDAFGNFSWTPVKSDVGTHTLTLTASDANGSTVSTATTITVSLTTPGPTVVASTTTTPSVSGTPGSTTSIVSNASQQDGYLFTKYLQVGSRGTAVTELQKHLVVDGLYGASNPISGYFGHLTFLAVQRFQAAHGIEQLGSVGPKTRAALNTE